MSIVGSRANFDKFDLFTQEYVDRSQVYDQLVDHDYTLGHYQEKGMIQTGKALDDKHEWRYRKDAPTKSQWASEWDTFALEGKDLHDMAQLETKDLVGHLTLSRKQIVRNMDSPEKIADILDEQLRSKLIELRGTLNESLFNDGTNPKSIVGLEAMISNTGTYAGINRATYTWWQSQVVSDTTNYTYANLSDATSGYDVKTLMVKIKYIMMNQKANISKNYMFVCNPAFAAAYEEMIMDFLQVQIDKMGKVDLDTDEVKFRKIPIYPDPDCPAYAGGISHNFLINTKDIQLIFGKEYAMSENKGLFSWTGWQSNSPKQLSFSGLFVASMVHVMNTPRLHLDLQCDGDTVGNITS